MSVKNKQHVELPDLTPTVSLLPPKKDSGFKIKFRSTCENQPEAFYLLIPLIPFGGQMPSQGKGSKYGPSF